MANIRWFGLITIAAALVWAPSVSSAAPLPGLDITGITEDDPDDVTVSGEADAFEHDSHGNLVPKRPETPPVKYLRADMTRCSLLDIDGPDAATMEAVCEAHRAASEADVIVIPACPAPGVQLSPLWVQRLQDDGTYGPPEQVGGYECRTPADLVSEAQRVFTTMHVPAPTATLQTGWDRLLVNAYYPVYTDAETVTQEATLLDVPVEIRAVPDRFVWDFDDPFSPGGGTLTTDDLGAPWQEGDEQPDDDWVAHAWTRLGDPGTAAGYAAGARWTEGRVKYRVDVTVTLATTWHGQFRIAGSPAWTDIPGDITTNSTAGTWTVTEARSKLVCDDLDGGSTC